jgi:hypothetical protein
LSCEYSIAKRLQPRHKNVGFSARNTPNVRN